MTHTNNCIIKSTFYTLLVGFLVWVTILMNASFTIRTLPVRQTYNVSIATFKIHSIQKVPIKDGYSVRISLESGLVWYGVSCAGLGLGLGTVLSTLRAKRTSE